MVCNDMFPFEETLIPLFKRKLMSQINQRSKKFKTTNIKNYGIQ